MEITLQTYKIKEIFNGFQDKGDEGVVAFGGMLNVRPAFQRELVYNEQEQAKVIETVLKQYPLNVMYWGSTPNNSEFELIDGQQRTMSICNFLAGKFTIKYGGVVHSFTSLPQEERDKINNYELQIYICDGTASEKLEWFRTINIAGKKLNSQELLNATYPGLFIEGAKRYFSKPNCPAKDVKGDYIKGNVVEQQILEKVLKWAADAEDTDIAGYMMKYQYDPNAAENLWRYFNDVLNWVRSIYPEKMLNIDKVEWGILYNKYAKEHFVDNDGNIKFYKKIGGEGIYPRTDLIKQVNELMEDGDVTKKAGAYTYVFSGDERALSIRAFDERTRQEVYLKQKGLCNHCKQKFDIKDMQADHKVAWSKGGKTEISNCQMLCAKCNNNKSARAENPQETAFCRQCGRPIEKGSTCTFCGTKN